LAPASAKRTNAAPGGWETRVSSFLLDVAQPGGAVFFFVPIAWQPRVMTARNRNGLPGWPLPTFEAAGFQPGSQIRKVRKICTTQVDPDMRIPKSMVA
jgi:hypothetical protein